MRERGGVALTPLSIAVLALLDERPMHPYEMYQLLLARRDDLLLKVRPGSLYHAVAKLADAALIEPEGTDRAGNRPERTTYRILDAGRELLQQRVTELLSVPVQEFPIFRLALSEAHSLPKDDVVAAVRTRIDYLNQDLADLDTLMEWARTRDVPRRYWMVAEYMHATVTAEERWLTHLCADLESGALEWETFDPVTGTRQPDTHQVWRPSETADLMPVPRWATRTS
ncbi:PadR family transcriptional regulator [Nocardia camponoti]|uniref:PadR family transcriptional regulator n=1 Tax=Nocardia camponoti TaxID=1616106 RepID=A0A917V6V1_9NOCA|nr:PadR family transcriptional regulator [Nocardia camponoti]GGK47191.1 PadR family transcriptional regulator [Nocardia camponoti]